MCSRSLRSVRHRCAVRYPVSAAVRHSHLASLPVVLSSHRCSAACLSHHTVRPFASAALPRSASRNPLPASSSGHTRSPSIGDNTFHPADPEVEGYKTRLTVERRVHQAITSLPKLRDHPALASTRPPKDSVAVDWWPIGHDDPLARLRLDSLDIDSLDKIELLTAVEKEFGVEFSDEQYERFAAVGDIIETLLWNPKAK